jgi:hypothetical protein
MGLGARLDSDIIRERLLHVRIGEKAHQSETMMGAGSFFLGFFTSDRTLMGPLSPSTYWALKCEWYLRVGQGNI